MHFLFLKLKSTAQLHSPMLLPSVMRTNKQHALTPPWDSTSTAEMPAPSAFCNPPQGWQRPYSPQKEQPASCDSKRAWAVQTQHQLLSGLGGSRILTFSNYVESLWDQDCIIKTHCMYFGLSPPNQWFLS